MAKETPQRIYSEERRARGKDASRESHGEVTNQSFKDECDINRVLARAQHGASLSHLLNHGGQYGDFSDWTADTYENMRIAFAKGESIFNDLPSEVRDEFDNNPGKFFEFVNNPANVDKLEEYLPALAEPGRQFPDVTGRDTAAALASAAESLKTLASASSDAPPDSGASEDPVDPK